MANLRFIIFGFLFFYIDGAIASPSLTSKQLHFIERNYVRWTKYCLNNPECGLTRNEKKLLGETIENFSETPSPLRLVDSKDPEYKYFTGDQSLEHRQSITFPKIGSPIYFNGRYFKTPTSIPKLLLMVFHELAHQTHFSDHTVIRSISKKLGQYFDAITQVYKNEENTAQVSITNETKNFADARSKSEKSSTTAQILIENGTEFYSLSSISEIETVADCPVTHQELYGVWLHNFSWLHSDSVSSSVPIYQLIGDLEYVCLNSKAPSIKRFSSQILIRFQQDLAATPALSLISREAISTLKNLNHLKLKNFIVQRSIGVMPSFFVRGEIDTLNGRDLYDCQINLSSDDFELFDRVSPPLIPIDDCKLINRGFKTFVEAKIAFNSIEIGSRVFFHSIKITQPEHTQPYFIPLSGTRSELNLDVSLGKSIRPSFLNFKSRNHPSLQAPFFVPLSESFSLEVTLPTSRPIIYMGFEYRIEDDFGNVTFGEKSSNGFIYTDNISLKFDANQTQSQSMGSLSFFLPQRSSLQSFSILRIRVIDDEFNENFVEAPQSFTVRVQN